MPSINANTAQTHRLVRRDFNGSVTIPVVVVIAILLVIAVISWIRVVKGRERAMKRQTGYMAAANPVLRARSYVPVPSEPKRPRTPPALRPRNEHSYVRRPPPVRPRTGSALPTPPLYRSQVGTPSVNPTSGEVPILEIPAIVQNSDRPAVVASQDPPPPYNAPAV